MSIIFPDNSASQVQTLELQDSVRHKSHFTLYNSMIVWCWDAPSTLVCSRYTRLAAAVLALRWLWNLRLDRCGPLERLGTRDAAARHKAARTPDVQLGESPAAFGIRRPTRTPSRSWPPGTARRTAPWPAEGWEPLGTPHDGWEAPPRGLDTSRRPGRGAGESKLPILDAPHSCRRRSHHSVAARQEPSRAEGT